MGQRKACYQLDNPSHKEDVIQLFHNAQRLRSIRTEDGNEIILIENQADLLMIEDNEPSDDIPLPTLPGIAGLLCSTCDVVFSTVLEQRQHFKLDWHRHNNRRKEYFQKPIGEAEFMEIMDGLSSISGSDSEGEDSVDTSSQLSALIEKTVLNIPSLPDPEYDKSQVNSKRHSRSPKIFFENNKNEVIAIYQTILPAAEVTLVVDNNEAYSSLNIEEVLNSPRKLGIIMLSGGHFAAGVFEGIKEVRHKTIHKYTVRAKQGGSQGRCDNKSGGSGPKSAGASLRRYNETSLTQEIQTLLKSWEEDFKQCQLIFYRVSGSSQKTIFGAKSSIFVKNNPRLRTIPFQTKRPTFREVKKALEELTSVQVFQKEIFMKRFLPASPGTSQQKNLPQNEGKSPEKQKKKKNINRARSRSPKTKEKPSVPTSPDEASDSELDVEFVLEQFPTELNLRNELQEFDDSLTSEDRERKITSRKRKPRSKNTEKVKIEPWGITSEILEGINTDAEGLAVARLQQNLETKTDNPEGVLHPQETLSTDLNQILDEENSRILHAAVKKNFLDLTWLLLENGSDPALKDKSGKYPYNWSPSKECRNLFRRFRGKFPEKYDYQKAQIPSPLTDEMEQEIAEKKKIQNKLKREKEKQKKVERKEKEEELDEQKRFLDLSDREKRALAADRRLLGQCKRNGEGKPVLVRCFDCALDITGKVPFEYNQNKFCSPKCLATHRKKFPVPLSI